MPEEEENFDEAINHVNSALVPTRVAAVLYQLSLTTVLCRLPS